MKHLPAKSVEMDPGEPSLLCVDSGLPFKSHCNDNHDHEDVKLDFETPADANQWYHSQDLDRFLSKESSKPSFALFCCSLRDRKINSKSVHTQKKIMIVRPSYDNKLSEVDNVSILMAKPSPSTSFIAFSYGQKFSPTGLP
ncbi:hypothetical protein TCAL_16315 [Tigriopus californicus]|uniref:Uncharacterized protein n=1 Tax=Tigriopus californicus TaxID=6832 RepID=A0A553N6U8_TIGCA|nr:hypothetical protein TCAL_16315 [Tigriopus californicus]